MNFIVRTGAVVAALLLAGCPGNEKAAYHVNNVVDRQHTRVDFAATDALLRGRTIVTRQVKNSDGTTSETVFVCVDAPPDVYALIGSNLSSTVGVAKKAADPTTVTAGLALAMSASGGQIQKAANQRRTDSLNESICNMFQGGAIEPRQYMLLQLVNTRVSVALAGMEAIDALVAKPSPPPVVTINAPAIASTAAPNPGDENGSTSGQQKKGGAQQGQAHPATTSTAPDPAVTRVVADLHAVTQATNAGKCDSKPTSQQAECNAKAGKSGAGTQQRANQSAAGATGANLPPNGDVTVPPAPQNTEVLLAAIQAIQQLATDGMKMDPTEVTCLLETSQAPLNADTWRRMCGSSADAVAQTDPSAGKPADEKMQEAFVGKRLFTQVEAAALSNEGTKLVLAMRENWGATLAIGPVEVRPGPSQLQIRYYARQAGDNQTADPDAIAAVALAKALADAQVFGKELIAVHNWTGQGAGYPSPGLLELWIPGTVSINASALTSNAASKTRPAVEALPRKKPVMTSNH